MNYPKPFFEINLRFAQKVAKIKQLPLEDALLHYTNFYLRFGLGRDFSSTNPIWQEYLEGLHMAEDITQWSYCFYLKRQEQVASQFYDSPFGCFYYTLVNGNDIHLHFRNNDASERSPLSQDRMGIRLAELRSMFVHIRPDAGEPANVSGASWLYNLEAYRRLFPPAYLATSQVSRNNFPYLSLWGQFVDHCGQIKENLVMRFLECMEKQDSLDGLEKCLPLQVMHLECSIHEFYQFYEA